MKVQLSGLQLLLLNGRMLKHFVITCAVVVIMAAGASAQRQYTVTDLGTLGGSSSNALGINSVGQVTGWASTGAETHAFLWTSGKMIDLGPTGLSSVGTAVNLSGLVVGITYIPFEVRSHAVLFAEDGVVDLGTMGGISSYAYDINDSGQIVLCAEGSPEGEGFLYNSVGANVVSLSPIIGVDGCPTAINNLGQMTGGYRDSTGTHAFIYSAGTLSEIGRLGGSAWGHYSFGFDISEKGDVVGSYLLVIDSNGNMVGRAFLYSGGTSIDLGDLGGGTSSASAINSHGEIVGESSRKQHRLNPREVKNVLADPKGRVFIPASRRWKTTVHAFLYTSREKMIDLNRFIPANTGWILESALGINDAGQIIATGGNARGEMHAFLLTPKKPRQLMQVFPMLAH